MSRNEKHLLQEPFTIDVGQCTVFNNVLAKGVWKILFFFNFMADFKNLGLFMKRNHIFDKNLKQYGHF